MSALTPDPKQRLVTSIRGYVHMDNLVESFNAQASNARELRSKHETDAIALIHQLGLQKSVIQISGSTLQLMHRNTPAALTWGYLSREIPAWAASAGVSHATATSLLTWLQEHRETKETETLKKGSKPIGPPTG